ncbi:MAG: isoprenylcysteine carboxylmethyltransferase family protein, partial [Sphingomonadales bacterium]
RRSLTLVRDDEILDGHHRAFAAIRHPIYTGLFAFMLAMAVAFGHWRGLILGVPLYWIGTWMRVSIEERLLRDQFGAAYDAYASRVKRFVPGLI